MRPSPTCRTPATARSVGPKGTGGAPAPSRPLGPPCHNLTVVDARRAAWIVLVSGLLVAGAVAAGPISLPAEVPEAARARVQPVTDQASLAVKVNGEAFVARRDVFEYLLDHPELATHVTRTLKLARYRIWRTPAGLAIDD